MMDYTPYRDASKEEESKIERKVQILESIEKSDLLWVLSDPRGRRFVWRLMSEDTVLLPTYFPGSSLDMVAYNEGKREMSLRLYSEVMDIDEKMFLKMKKEAKKFDRKRRELNDDAGIDE